MSDRDLAQVCLPVPVNTAFTYRIPAHMRGDVTRGRRLLVPFGNRSIAGWCVGFAEPPEPGKDGKIPDLKEVEAVLDDGPLLDSRFLRLARWISETYACSWGEALSACVPAGVRSQTAEATVLHVCLAKPHDEIEVHVQALADKHPKRSRVLRVLLDHPEGLGLRDLVRAARCSDSPPRTLAKHGLVVVRRKVLDLDPFAGAEPEPPAGVTLTDEQDLALQQIHAVVDRREAKTFLLFGVTGSGKTEVYLRAIDHCIRSGRQAVVLVPEIALTPQTVARFRGWFDRVAVLHSALTDAERRRQWNRIKAGRADVVIGPRSAVFAPVADLGLVVVDEEHETSFKQQSAPRYHARDVAVERAQQCGAVVVLGSATPSLESWDGAVRGKFGLLRLPSRVGAARLPKVDVIDLVEEARETKRRGLFSRRLIVLLENAFARRRQALLFLNRRGFATAVYCSACGGSLSCPRCSVSLTFHLRHGTVLCHPCGHEQPMPRACPDCHSPGLARLGAGTERLEDAVRRRFPGVRMGRMDSDVMHDRASYERVLTDFRTGRLDLLVGTQMIAKGLHFPNVTVVGVISADTSLMLPDFRAAERTFQLVAQVAGRAGRSDLAGNVVVQTVQPRHPAIVHAAKHDFEGFAAQELAERTRFSWPPSARLVRVVVTARKDLAASRRADEVAVALRTSLPPDAVEILGPAPCPVARLRDRFRWHLVAKAADEPVQRAAVYRLARMSRRARGAEITVDVDPTDMG